MLYWAAVFFVIALLAAVFGFGGIAASAVGVAKILFFVFLGAGDHFADLRPSRANVTVAQAGTPAEALSAVRNARAKARAFLRLEANEAKAFLVRATLGLVALWLALLLVRIAAPPPVASALLATQAWPFVVANMATTLALAIGAALVAARELLHSGRQEIWEPVETPLSNPHDERHQAPRAESLQEVSRNGEHLAARLRSELSPGVIVGVAVAGTAVAIGLTVALVRRSQRRQHWLAPEAPSPLANAAKAAGLWALRMLARRVAQEVVSRLAAPSEAPESVAASPN